MHLILFVLLMIAPSVALAQTASPTKVDQDKKICRIEIDTGSIFHRRVCHTKAEWAEISAVDQKNTENFQNRRATNIPTTDQ